MLIAICKKRAVINCTLTDKLFPRCSAGYEGYCSNNNVNVPSIKYNNLNLYVNKYLLLVNTHACKVNSRFHYYRYYYSYCYRKKTNFVQEKKMKAGCFIMRNIKKQMKLNNLYIVTTFICVNTFILGSHGKKNFVVEEFI